MTQFLICHLEFTAFYGHNLDMDEFNEWLAEQELAKTNVIEINKMAN